MGKGISYFVMRYRLFLSILLAGLLFSGGPTTDIEPLSRPFWPISEDEADSLMQQLSTEERIAQSFILKQSEGSKWMPAGYLLSEVSSRKALELTPTDAIPPIFGVDLINDTSIRRTLHLPRAEQISSLRSSERAFQVDPSSPA